MNIAEARAHDDGIDFYVSGKNIYISARRNKDGKVIITRENKVRPIKKMRYKEIFIFAIVVCFMLINNLTKGIDWRLRSLSMLALVWMAIFLYYYIEFKNPKNSKCFRYHAAEHKALNFFDKYNSISLDVEKVMEMKSISFRCGSTVIAVLLVLTTWIMVGFVCMPWLIAKILFALLGIVCTLYLWANGMCDFFQRFTLKEPTKDEVEVAVRGMWEYMKMKVE